MWCAFVVCVCVCRVVCGVSVVWSGMVWFGVVWCSLVCVCVCGVLWSSAVQRGVLRYAFL